MRTRNKDSSRDCFDATVSLQLTGVPASCKGRATGQDSLRKGCICVHEGCAKVVPALQVQQGFLCTRDSQNDNVTEQIGLTCVAPKAGVVAAPKAPPLCARPKAGVLAGLPKPNPPEAAAGWPNAGVVAAPKAADACVCARELSGSHTSRRLPGCGCAKRCWRLQQLQGGIIYDILHSEYLRMRAAARRNGTPAAGQKQECCQS